jgi:hypothetical protein
MVYFFDALDEVGSVWYEQRALQTHRKQHAHQLSASVYSGVIACTTKCRRYIYCFKFYGLNQVEK